MVTMGIACVVDAFIGKVMGLTLELEMEALEDIKGYREWNICCARLELVE